MPNLPLDANDEDILQRGLRRPSIDNVLLPLNETYQAVRSQYDNFAPGLLSTDNIWPLRNAAELSNLLPAQRREFLEQRGLAPPADSIPYDADLSGLDQIVEELGSSTGSAITQQLASAGLFTERLEDVQSRLDAALAAGGDVPTDSYGQTLQGPTTQPTPLTTAPPGGSYTPPGTQPRASSNAVYNYTPIDLYDDRYDFLTGQIIRKGIATGAKGGVGAEDGPGNTLPSQGLSTDQQTETQAPPANVGPNDTASEQYDDAILRQARIQDNASTQMATSTAGAGRGNGAAELAQRRADAAAASATPTNRTETNPPRAEQASRYDIITSRRQAAQDARAARSRGENLVLVRRPNGTYYASPPRDNGDRRLPQRTRDVDF